MKTRNRWKDEIKLFEYLPKEFQKNSMKIEKMEILNDLQKISSDKIDLNNKDGQRKAINLNEQQNIYLDQKANHKKQNEKDIIENGLTSEASKKLNNLRINDAIQGLYNYCKSRWKDETHNKKKIKRAKKDEKQFIKRTKNGSNEKPSVINNSTEKRIEFEKFEKFEEFKKSEQILTSLGTNLSNSIFFSRFKNNSFNLLEDCCPFIKFIEPTLLEAKNPIIQETISEKVKTSSIHVFISHFTFCDQQKKLLDQNQNIKMNGFAKNNIEAQ